MTRTVPIVLLPLLLMMCRLQAQPGNYRFSNFTATEGLQDKVVYNAAQDKTGYMWFGTSTGLYRYDGHRFIHMRSTIDKAGSNISNILQGIMCDDDGNLWLGSLTTLQWYNPARNVFWSPDPDKPGNRQMAASYFYNFSKGKYTWCSTAKNYVYRFNKRDSSFLSLAPNYPPGASTTSLNTAEAGDRLYDIHPEAIYIFDLSGKFVNQVKYAPGDISNATYIPADKAIYLATYTSGLLKFDIPSGQIASAMAENQSLRSNYIYSINRDDEGNYYIGATSLFIINPEKKLLVDFYSKEGVTEFGITATKIVSIFIDREKNRWFCSHNGLSMQSWQNNQASTIMLKDEQTGYTTEAFGAYQDPLTKDILLTNTSSRGLQQISAGTGQVITAVNPAEPDPGRKRITGIIIAPDNTVYASDDNHFLEYNPASHTFTSFPLTDQDGSPIRNVARNVTDQSGRIFIGTGNHGFYIWQYRANKLIHYNKWDVIKNDSVARDNIINPCLVDGRQNVWFTGSRGVYEFRQNENKYYHHAPPAGSNVPPIDESQYIAADHNGHIWIATLNNGLYEFYIEGEKEVWKNYTVNSGIGLPSDYCVKIKQDLHDSLLWISNTAGLLKFDPVRRKVVSVLSKQNGLYAEGHGYSFNLFPGNQLVQLYYGAANIINLGTYRKNLLKPVVHLNSVKVMDEEKGFGIDGGNRKLVVGHNQNFFQFEFAALVFNNGNKNQYAYMLEGADKDWVYSGQANTASYSGLRPGSYTFRVKAANNDGLWGEETTLRIIIRPPFYVRWWFLALCGILAGLLIWTWNRSRIRQARKEEQLKASFQRQIAETEMKALRAQMNPHFIFNSLNSIQKYILKNEHFEASQYLTKFSRLIRLILDHSNQNTIPLSSELDLLKLYIEMESLRFDHQFDYSLQLADNLNAETIEVPSMLIQPYVENAIWHGLLHKDTRGRLDIRFSKDENNLLTVTIDDDGIGREKAAELKSKQVLKKKSYGMQITEDRIAIINRTQHIHATCRITDKKDALGNPTGTTVVLTIPVKPLTN